METIKLIFEITFGVLGLVLLALMGWYGFTFEIGKKGEHFHLWHETYSLKRFFIKKKNSLKDIAGKWPGNETDEQFNEILKSEQNEIKRTKDR